MKKFLPAIIFTALLWSDFFNYIFSSSVLIGWKQAIVVCFWMIALAREISNSKNTRVPLAVISATTLLILIAWSILIKEVEPSIAAYNSFLYLSWVPIFLVLHRKREYLFDLLMTYQHLFLVLLILSVIGLYVDWHTDTFNWLEKQISSVQLLEEAGIARRASFFFISSTMVIPLLSIPGILYYITNQTAFRAFMVSLCLILAVIPTGSGSSLLVATGCIIGVLVSRGIKNLKVILYLSAILTVAPIISVFLSDNRTILQIERLSTAFSASTEANVGRQGYWEDALSNISQMSGSELIIGYGLGSTNENKGNFAQYGHGESSLFQAMIECGLLGVISRILPFILIILVISRRFLKRRNEARDTVILFWTLSSFFAISTAPTFGNIPFQFVLAIMILIAIKPAKIYHHRNE